MLYLHRINTPWRAVAAAVLCVLMLDSPGCFVARVQGFAPRPQLLSSQRQCRFIGGGSFRLEPRSTRNRKQSSSKTSLNMFLGSDGGILGIGTPEVFTILIVGYFILGPNDLYKLVKEIGKFVQNFRTLGTESMASFQSSMEDQLEIQELRKAQRELNDAFSFRRSINVDREGEAFSTTVTSEKVGAEPMIADDVVSSSKKPKKKIRRRKKKVETEVEDEASSAANGETSFPDLDMTAPFTDEDTDLEAERIRQERRERLEGGQLDEIALDWKGDDNKPGLSAADLARAEHDWLSGEAEQNRFATQFSGDWNEQILAKENELAPLATIMQKLALLEEEKNAAKTRLEEEFRRRAAIEEDYYQQQRELLEDAVTEMQASAYSSSED